MSETPPSFCDIEERVEMFTAVVDKALDFYQKRDFTFEEAAAIISKIRLRLADRMVVVSAIPTPDCMLIRVECGVTNRDVGNLLNPTVFVSSNLKIGKAQVTDTSKRDLLDIARKLIHHVVTHEVDEWLMVDGVRVFDPHIGVQV
jgi:hypothetical protein